MAEYIEREALIANFESAGAKFVYGDGIVKGIISRINLQPAADVVKVVRCKDCCYGKNNTCVTSDPEWFCADGERVIDND